MSQTPGTYLYPPGSSSDVFLSHGSQLEPLELGGGQLCFAISGSFAEARGLDLRWRAGATSGAQGSIFTRPGGHMQRDTEPMLVPMTMAVDGISSGRIGHHAAPGYGSTTIDTFQDVFPAVIESRRVNVFPSPCTIQVTPPMTPVSVDSGLSSFSNTMPSLLNCSGGDPSMCSPFASGYQPRHHDYGFGHELWTPPITPASQSVPLGYAMGDTQDMETSDPISRRRRPKSRSKGSLLTVLWDLQGLRLTVVDLLMAIIDGNGEFEGFRNALFSPKPKNRAALLGLLDRLIQDDKG
ncbi:hypothetical protein EDB86DRAFT_3088635 [Lactarius hatsudake]|nr:hypothetical protein EDB86DRAFT_3088635 [Lactarius hatsudake]